MAPKLAIPVERALAATTANSRNQIPGPFAADSSNFNSILKTCSRTTPEQLSQGRTLAAMQVTQRIAQKLAAFAGDGLWALGSGLWALECQREQRISRHWGG